MEKTGEMDGGPWSRGTRAMATAVSTAAPARSLQGPELKQLLHQLRKTDNLTNWFYILRTYVYLVLVIGGAVWFFESQAVWGISFWWNVPVALLAGCLV